MLAIEARNVKKYYGITEIFSDISFQVNEKDKVGFVGQNGCGKTTLFKIIKGTEDHKEGLLTIKKGLTLGYLDQIPEYPEHFSVMDVLDMAFSDVNELSKQMKKLEHEMSVMKDKELESTMKNYAEVQHMFEVKGGYKTEENIAKVCNGLGFLEIFKNKKFNKLSGGEKTKVILAKILLEAPDVLLLDEPTNHLDIDAVEWLEEFIKGYQGTVLIISHDRYFLDKVVSKIIEIEAGETETYHGNYTFYTEEKERQLLADLVVYNNQQREIKDMENAIRRFKDWGTRSDDPRMFKKMHNMEKRIEKMDKMDRPVLERKKMRLSFDEANRTGNDVLEVREYSKSFRENKLFHNANMKLNYLDSAAVIGANGSGKSTIIKSILKEYYERLDDRAKREFPHIKDLDLYIKDSGVIKLGTNLKLAYLDQNINFGNEENTVLEEFRENIFIDEKNARTVLARFLFFKDDVFKKVKSLSGGEKTRLRLCQLVQQKINFLVLDEPTNHLDIDSKQALEETLIDFEGTILFISHDRYFINRLANKIFEVADKRIKCYEGNYDYYKNEKNKANLRKEPEKEVKQEKVSLDKKSYIETVEERAKIKKKQNLENKIYDLEKKLEDIDAKMEEFGDDYAKLQELLKDRWKVQTELDGVYKEWDEL